jgi:hypothetical protein
MKSKSWDRSKGLRCRTSALRRHVKRLKVWRARKTRHKVREELAAGNEEIHVPEVTGAWDLA